jgi:hypothetical protein
MLRETHDARVDDAPLLDDWLGLAGYLAESVSANDVTVETAQAELAAAATGADDRRALARAADVAATQLGTESRITALLHWAATHSTPEAEVA